MQWYRTYVLSGIHFNYSFIFDAGPDCSSYVLRMLSCPVLVLDHSLLRSPESGIHCYFWDSSMLTFLMCFCSPSGWDLLYLVIQWAGDGSTMLYRFHMFSKTQWDVIFQVLLPPAPRAEAWWIWVTGRVSRDRTMMLVRNHSTVVLMQEVRIYEEWALGILMPPGWDFGRTVLWFFPLSCNSFAKPPTPLQMLILISPF